MLFSKFFNIRKTPFDQSSPVQPISESRGGGGYPVPDGGRRTKEILLSNVGVTVWTDMGSVTCYLIFHNQEKWLPNKKLKKKHYYIPYDVYFNSFFYK